MQRILQIVSTMDYGGAETLLMSIYRKIDRTKLQFDFLCLNRTESKFFEEIHSLGGRMFKVDSPRYVGIRQYCQQLYRFFIEHPEYRIVHAHLNRDSAFSLWMAKCAGVPNRISHSHVANVPYSVHYRLYTSVAKFINNRCLTDRFACSEDAGKYLFGSKVSFHLMPNAIDTEKFTFDENRRMLIRNRMKLVEGQILIGHVGRFSPEKNHVFLLRLFAELAYREAKCRLVLLGGGGLEQAIRRQVEELGITDKVIFAGLQSDTSSYYAAMDLFLFPSIFEGLGIVAIEAQCAGLPVIASTMVPKFAKVTDLMEFVSLGETLDTWCDIILKHLSSLPANRKSYALEVARSPYNVDNIVEFLQNYYLNLSN